VTPLRILIVEDSEDDTELVLRELRRHGYEPQAERVDTPESLRAALSRQAWDVVISDFAMPRLSGLDALKIAQETDPDVPFVILSGSIGEDIAVQAMKAGAHDYIMKDNTQRLVPVIERELKEARNRHERRLAEERIRFLAYYDPVTELPNRTSLDERVREALRGTRHDRFALMMLALTHFHEIRNTLGHDHGERLMKQVAERLRGLMHQTDMVARLSMHEFGVLHLDADYQEAVETAERIRRNLREPFDLAGFTMNLGVNIGLTLFPEHDEDPAALMRHADAALYQAVKENSGLVVYNAERDPYKPGRLELMSELRDAVDAGEIFLNFQPKVRSRDRCLSGVEALARWRHPRRGPIPPDEFIRLAEESGVIDALTVSVLERAREQARAWRRLGWEIPIAVNLSVKNLHAETHIEKLFELMSHHGKDTNPIELEITESAIMLDPAFSLDVLTKFKLLGARLYIDDFGTGHSSLSYLRKLPIDAIKIDKSFVLDMARDPDAAMIVRSTIELAHNLGYQVVAEGVETAAVWEYLAAYGCDEIQGYFISRPLTADDFEAWARSAPWTWPKPETAS